MTFDQIQKLSNEMLGEKIAKYFGWRIFKSNGTAMFDPYPKHFMNRCEAIPQSLDLISRVESLLREKAVAEDSEIFDEYGRLLFYSVINFYPRDLPPQSKFGTDFAMIATASARLRAELALLVLQ